MFTEAREITQRGRRQKPRISRQDYDVAPLTWLTQNIRAMQGGNGISIYSEN